MIAKCSRDQLGEFLEDIMKNDKEIEFFISDEESMSERIEDDMDIAEQIRILCDLRSVVYIIVEDDDYDNAIEQIYGPMQKKYDDVFGNIVEKIRNTSEINDYILGRGGSDYLLVSNAEYGETKYIIHKTEKSEDLNEDNYLF